jgi:hypothetical protein
MVYEDPAGHAGHCMEAGGVGRAVEVLEELDEGVVVRAARRRAGGCEDTTKLISEEIGLIVSQHFGYAIDKRYLPVLFPYRLQREKDGVTLTDEGSFVATFGRFTLTTPLANITGAHITRNYRWWTAFGIRTSRVDDGLSLGTNRDGGVCVHFADKVPSKHGESGHSALTVTVADLEGLTVALGGDNDDPPAASSA